MRIDILAHWGIYPYVLALPFLLRTSAETRTVCSNVQLEAYCDIQTTSYTSIYEKSTLYEYDESYTNIMTDLEKQLHSISSFNSGGSLGFKGFTISGKKETSKILKTYLKESINVVKHDIKEKFNEHEKKHTFQPGSYQYFRVITTILTINGHSYETTAKTFVYSSPKHDEYDITLQRYCPRQMRREFKVKELEFDTGIQTACVEQPIPIQNGMRICFWEKEGSSQCKGARNTCSGWSSKPVWSDVFFDDTDGRAGGCLYHWKIEELEPQPNYEYRVCFRETEGSSQCGGTRNSCTGWTRSPSWTPGFWDDTDRRSGGCRYQWKTEQRKVPSTTALDIPACRVCFKETHASSQCGGNRRACSGWSTEKNPRWSQGYWDDTDRRSGGCMYHWYLDCVPKHLISKCTNAYNPCI